MSNSSPYAWYEYGLVILLNARTFISLAGVLLIVYGSWKWDRDWDDQKYVETYTDMNDGETRLRHEKQKGAKKDSCLEMDCIDLDAATNRTSMIGWLLLGFSYFLESHTWFSFDTTDTAFLIVPTVVILVAVAFLQTVMIPAAMANRTMGSKQLMYGLLLIGGYAVLGALSLMLNETPTRALAPLGAICIALSPLAMWRSRIMGETFDETGLANQKPVLFNYGGPLLIFGWFCFWIAHNTIHEHPNLDYIPFYPDIPTFLSFLAASIIVVVYWLVGYALDEMPVNGDKIAIPSSEAAAAEGGQVPTASDTHKPDTLEALEEAPAFGIEEFFFGYVFELKFLYAVAWALFGVAYILRTHDKAVWPSVIFLFLAIGVGVSTGLVQQKGLRKKDVEQVSRWMRVSDILLLVLFLVVCCERRISAIITTAIGIVLMGSGLYHLHDDRKRGKHWLQTDQIKMPPVVYSLGAVAYPLGMLLFAWGVSIHPKT